jgi:metal-sulfur cluster biosynthetic enzyme
MLHLTHRLVFLRVVVHQNEYRWLMGIFGMVEKERVLEALRNCYDPEIPVNIVDLGLIYDLRIDGGSVFIKMTLTAQGCPAHAFLKEEVERQLLQVPGVDSAQVDIVWDPPWTPDRMSDEAKKQFGFDRPQELSVPLEIKPLRAGSSRSAPDGSNLLVNTRGEAYKVSDDVKAVWELCDGSKSVGEVVDVLAERLGAPSEDIAGQVAQMVYEMLQLGLLVNPDEFVQLDLT